ncbi:MAG TPA: amino acid permease [Gemmataceae bacterium]|nr:amino acid permease [Gemmataceae bacterium]
MKPAPSGPPSGLVRALGPLMATAVVVGTVIGSGVFKKPQSVAAHVHQFGLAALVWVLGGLLVLLGALAYAEVAVLYPKAGGNYVFLREAYGRLAGFLWGWVEFWIIRSASLAALATVFTESVHDVLTNRAFQSAVGLPEGTHLGFWAQRGLTVAVLVGLALVNVRGVKWGGLLQLFITIVKVGSLLAIAVLPFVVLAAANAGTAPPVRAANLRPTWPASLTEVSLAGLGSAMLGVLWAYHGWMNIAPVAEEIRRPQRNIPLALLGGVAIIITVYLGANLAYYLVIPRPEMAEMKNTPVATEFSLRLLGPLGGAAASAAVMCSVFGALNGNLLVGPRLLYAMGEDGLAPRALAAVHARYRTPALAIAVLAAWSVLLVLVVAVLTETGLLDPAKSHFDRLTDFAMFGAVIFETMAVLSIFVFRRRYPDAERPYRCWGYPLVPALYVVLPAFVLVNMFSAQPAEAIAGLGFIALGAGAYFLFGLGKRRPTAFVGVGEMRLDAKPPPVAPEGVQRKDQVSG